MKSRRHTSMAAVLACATAIAFAAVEPATAAKKKISYDEAWKICSDEAKRAVPGGEPGQRMAAGGGCMKKHGYRLKKSSTM